MKVKDIKKIKIGDCITVSDHPSATNFTVVSKGPGFLIDIQESNLHKAQTIDICQVKHHIVK